MTATRIVPPRGSRTAAPRDRTAGLRRGVVVLAIALTAMAGPLGRSTEQAPADDTFRLGTVTSSALPAPR